MMNDEDERDIVGVRDYLITFLRTIDQELTKRHQGRVEVISWSKLVEPSLAVGSTITGLEDGCLMVSCQHSAHLQLLNLHKVQIIKRLRQHYPTLQIMTIKGFISKDFAKKDDNVFRNEVVKRDEQEDEVFQNILLRLKQIGQ